MKKKILLFLFLAVSINIFAQNKNNLNADLIELSEIYRNFYTVEYPTMEEYRKLWKIKAKELHLASEFVEQAITSNNKLANIEFLTLPDTSSLRYIYIIMQLKENNKKKNNKNKNPRDENELINKLLNKDIDYNRLVSCYYSNLFYGIIMKNKPFDMSEVNLELDKYNLKNETEKAIFYMVSMEMFYISLQRYMKVIPTDYKQGLKKINEFPKYNGKPYYHYEFFDFQDIDIKFNNRKRSFKAFVINRLYDTLIFHLECLEQKKKYNEARLDLISNSILSKEIYYKYSEKKELLDSLF